MMTWRRGRHCGSPRFGFGVRALIAALALLAVTGGPARAQFDGGFRFPFPFFDHYDHYERRPQPAPSWPGRESEPRPQIDYSKAPPPHKSDTSPTTHIVVMGDAMADWLGYGLEDAFGESPEVGVVRKHRTYSGLVHGDSKNAYDWPQAARDILATEKADYIVMMIGMADRQSIREKRGGPPKPNTPAGPGANAPGDAAAHDDEAQAGPEDSPAVIAPEPTRTGTSTYEFRSEPWADVYAKRIDEMIAVLKSKGVPVFWVGLPALRGTRSTADMAYLNNLYRSRAEKAGIVFVDVWDGFVDENGNFTTHGPDFEGQTRRLRSADGVYFTKAGAQKLAHYVEREIQRAMATHNSPLATPAPEEPATQTAAHPGTQPAARPVAGPVVPLTTVSGGQEELLGGGPTRATAAVDPNATKVLVKGDPPPSLTGRADDFAWPKTDAAAPTEVAPPQPPPAATDAPQDAVSTKKSPSPPKPARSAETPSHHAIKRARRPTSEQATIPRTTTPMAYDGMRGSNAYDVPRPPGAFDAVRPPGSIPGR
jgi:uncharacterized protein